MVPILSTAFLPLVLPLASALACSPSEGSAATATPPASAQPISAEQFDAVWYDGQAELNGYRWSGSRYGNARTGEAVAIFVTETMGAKEHVKVDRPADYRGETLTVLKLNLVRDFQTGLYDYNTMASAFANVNDLRALKVSFSSAEWCGHVYEELDARPKGLEVDVRSYFQGESVQKTLAAKPDGLVGEHLLIWLRGLRGHVLQPGETRTLAYLPDAFERRLRHREAEWGELRVTREGQGQSVTVPAGTFPAVVYRLAAGDGRTGAVLIEDAYPHRLLAWTWERDGEILDAAELTGSQRMKYWELHDPGQESLRAKLGLDG